MRQNRLIDRTNPSELMQGVYKDQHPLQSPMWAELRNVILKDGLVKKMKGNVSAFVKPGSAPIRGVGEQEYSGAQRLFFGDQANMWMWNAVSVTNLKSDFTGILHETSSALATGYSFVDWGNWMLVTNDVDPVQVSKAGAALTTLANTTFSRARILLKLKNHVLAFNTSNGQNFVEWCSVSDVETWVASSGNSAGNLPLRDLDGPIMAAALLGGVIAIYGKNQLIFLRYIGTPFYFGQSEGLHGIGAVGPRAVYSDGRYNYGISRQGFWRTDGVSVVELDRPQLNQWLQDNLNWDQASKFHVVKNKDQGLIEFYVITNDAGDLEPDLCLKYDPQTKQFVESDVAYSATQHRQIFKWGLGGGKDGSVVFTEFSKNLDTTTPLTATIITKPMPAGSVETRKYIDEAKVLFTNLSGTVSLQIGASERLPTAGHANVTWGNVITPEENLDIYYPGEIDGLFIYLKVELTGLDSDFSFAGFSLYGQGAGEDQEDHNV